MSKIYDYYTEHVRVNNVSMTVKEAIDSIGVKARGVSYRSRRKKTDLYFHLLLKNEVRIQVHKMIWEQFEMLPVEVKKEKKKCYYKRESSR